MGKKAFSALSLLCRNAVEIMKVLSVNGGDDDFHTHDKTGCNDRAAPSLKMRSSPIHVWNSSHGIYRSDYYKWPHTTTSHPVFEKRNDSHSSSTSLSSKIRTHHDIR